MGPEAGASGRALSVAELKKLTAQRIGSTSTGSGAQHSAHPTRHYQPPGNGGHAHRAALPGQQHRGYGHPNAHHSAGYAPRPAPAGFGHHARATASAAGASPHAQPYHHKQPHVSPHAPRGAGGLRDAGVSGGAAPLPHGLTVQELKQLTAIRLASATAPPSGVGAAAGAAASGVLAGASSAAIASAAVAAGSAPRVAGTPPRQRPEAATAWGGAASGPHSAPPAAHSSPALARARERAVGVCDMDSVRRRVPVDNDGLNTRAAGGAKGATVTRGATAAASAAHPPRGLSSAEVAPPPPAHAIEPTKRSANTNATTAAAPTTALAGGVCDAKRATFSGAAPPPPPATAAAAAAAVVTAVASASATAAAAAVPSAPPQNGSAVPPPLPLGRCRSRSSSAMSGGSPFGEDLAFSMCEFVLSTPRSPSNTSRSNSAGAPDSSGSGGTPRFQPIVVISEEEGEDAKALDGAAAAGHERVKREPAAAASTAAATPRMHEASHDSDAATPAEGGNSTGEPIGDENDAEVANVLAAPSNAAADAPDAPAEHAVDQSAADGAAATEGAASAATAIIGTAAAVHDSSIYEELGVDAADDTEGEEADTVGQLAGVGQLSPVAKGLDDMENLIRGDAAMSRSVRQHGSPPHSGAISGRASPCSAGSRREPRVRGSPRGSPRVSPRTSPSRAMWSSPHGGGRARPAQSRSSPLSTRTSPLQVLVPLGDTD